MECTIEMIERFLELFEREQVIWNPKDEGHKNRNSVYDTWARIKVNFNDGSIPIHELKKKKVNLMGTFRKLHAKVKANATSGSGANEIFTPNWPFYEQMAKFLQSIYKPAKTISSGRDNIESDVEIIEEEVVIPEDCEVNKDIKTANNSFKKPTHQNSKNKRKIEDQIEHAYGVLKKISAEPEPVEDECTLYTKLLCAKLKSLDPLTRDIAMHDIDNVMFRLKQQQFLGFQQACPRFHSSPNQHLVGLQLPVPPPTYHQNTPSSVGFQTSPFQSFQLSPESYFQQRTNFQPSLQSRSERPKHFRPSSQSHSQRLKNFRPSPKPKCLRLINFQPSPQPHEFQPAAQPHNFQLATQPHDFQPSPRPHSVQSDDYQSSSPSHSKQFAEIHLSPQSHSKQSTNFQPSPHSISQYSQSSDVEEYSHSQPFSGVKSSSKERTINHLYEDEVAKLFEQSESII